MGRVEAASVHRYLHAPGSNADCGVIGVFDSGVGGLTVLAALRRRLPNADLLYLGDTARVPYGTRSPGTVRRYAARCASALHQSHGIDALVVACNTATAHALESLTASASAAGIPVIGVVEPGVEAAVAVTRGSVAVIGTEGTIRAGSYQTALQARGYAVQAQACPLFVSLAEEGWTDDPVTQLVATRYLAHLDADTVILGCTHYPLLRRVIQRVLPAARLVDSADATAQATAARLGELEGSGTTRFLVTDNLERFRTVGERFLGWAPTPVELVDLPDPTGPFALNLSLR